MRAGGGWPKAKAARKGRGKVRFPRLRRLGATAAAPFVKAGRFVAERFTEASSIGELVTGLSTFAMVQSYGSTRIAVACLALSCGKILLPDGTLSFKRDTRRRRRRPSR